MSYQKIDPYASESSFGGTIRDAGSVGLSMLNPLNIYKYLPGTYSVRAGDVKLPTAYRAKGAGISVIKSKMIDIWSSKNNGGSWKAVNETRKAVFDYLTPRFASETAGWMNDNKSHIVNALGSKNAVQQRVSSNLKLAEGRLNRIISSGKNTEVAKKALEQFNKMGGINMSSEVFDDGFKALGAKINHYRTIPAEEKFLYKQLTKTKNHMSSAKTFNIAVKGQVAPKFFNTIAGKGALIAAKSFAAYNAAALLLSVGSMIGVPIGEAAVGGMDSALSRLRDRFSPEMSRQRLHPSFVTPGASTERQRAINALSKAGLNARSGFGEEAMMVHQ